MYALSKFKRRNYFFLLSIKDLNTRKKKSLFKKKRFLTSINFTGKFSRRYFLLQNTSECNYYYQQLFVVTLEKTMESMRKKNMKKHTRLYYLSRYKYLVG